MAVFRLVILETENGFRLFDTQNGDLSSSIEMVDQDDIQTASDSIDYESDEDSVIEYEEITILRVNRHRRSFEDILAILLDDCIDEFLMTGCAPAA